MTETKNFALKLPDPTDKVDIGVLNENFEKIDEEMGPYELDLRELVTYDSANENTTKSIDLHDILDGTTLTELVQAVQSRKNIRIQFKWIAAGLLGDIEYYATAVLDRHKEDAEDDPAYMASGLLLPGRTLDGSFVVRLYCSKDENGAWSASLNFEDTFDSSSYYLVSYLKDVELPIDTAASMEVDLSSIVDIDQLKSIRGDHRTLKIITADGYYIALPDYRRINGPSFMFSGIATHSEDKTLCHKAELIVDEDAGTVMFYWNAIQAGGGAAEEAIPTNTTVVRSDGTVTITTTLEGDKQSVTTITVDENDYPTKINVDGTEWPVTWEGF